MSESKITHRKKTSTKAKKKKTDKTQEEQKGKKLTFKEKEEIEKKKFEGEFLGWTFNPLTLVKNFLYDMFRFEKARRWAVKDEINGEYKNLIERDAKKYRLMYVNENFESKKKQLLQEREMKKDLDDDEKLKDADVQEILEIEWETFELEEKRSYLKRHNLAQMKSNWQKFKRALAFLNQIRLILFFLITTKLVLGVTWYFCWSFGGGDLFNAWVDKDIPWDLRMENFKKVMINIFLMQFADVTFWKLHHFAEHKMGTYFHKLSYIVYKELLYKDKEYYDMYDMGKLNSYANSHDQIQRVFSHKMAELTRIVSWCTCCVIGMYYVHSKLVFYLIIPTFILVPQMRYWSKVWFTRHRRTKKLHKNKHQIIAETIGSIHLVKNFSVEKKKVNELKKINEELIKYRTDFRDLDHVFGACWLISEVIQRYLIGVVLGELLFKGLLNFGHFKVLNEQQGCFRWICTWYLPYLTDIENELNKSTNFFRLFDHIPGIDNFKGEQIEDIQGNIAFHDVSFKYPSKPTVKVLENIDCKINKGETVAFVGGSGSGKSTVISLLMRLYDPNKGTITVDGKDLKDLDLPWFHQKATAVVSQEPEMFEGTIHYNITYGVDDYTEEDVTNAAKQADAHKFIMDPYKFPDGYQTLVGEKGVKLSGGQKQRLAIARALIKKPKILVFDEATSALDMIIEKNIQKSIDENIIAKGGLTIIQIAHRLSTIKNSDRIFMLEEGKIVEVGSYEHLMGLKGKFYELVKIQTEEHKVKRRKKKIEEGKIDLEEEEAFQDLNKLDKIISTHSIRMKQLSVKSRKASSKKLKKPMQPLPLKHLSSMKENWRKLRMKVKIGKKFQALKEKIRQEEKLSLKKAAQKALKKKKENEALTKKDDKMKHKVLQLSRDSSVKEAGEI